MQVLIWILTVGALAAMYWAFRVNQNFMLRMLVFAAVGAVYILGILQGMDGVWFNGTTVAILVIAFWPGQKKGTGARAAPGISEAPAVPEGHSASEPPDAPGSEGSDPRTS